MSHGPLLIGLDGGTEGLRVGIFDTSGTPLVYVRNAYPTNFLRPGWAEQNPDDWWSAAVAGVRQAMDEIHAEPADIAAIAVGATSCTVVCLDDAGRVIRPAIIWMDVRAEQEASDIAASGSPSLDLSGQHHASAEWLTSKSLWLSRHEPSTYEKTSWIAEYTDFLTWRLSGEKVASLNTAAIRAYYDREKGGWASELYARVGIADLVDKLPDTVVPMGTAVGNLTASAAEELGLDPATRVVMGGADAFVAQVGLGVVNPGAMALITGSSHLLLLQTAKRTHGEGTWGSYPDAVIEGQYTVEGGQTSSGSMVGWFRNLVGGQASEEFFRELTSKAEQLPPGSDGLLVLDHFQGNRTPYVDARSRGALLGLSLSHQREHIFRAMIESVCFGSENTMRRFKEQGHNISEVVVSGGAVNNPFWLAMHANVSGVPLQVTKVAESATLGPALLAGVGAEIFSSIQEGVDQMVHVDYQIQPDQEITKAYQPLFDEYRAAYEALAPTLHRLSARQKGESASGA